MSARRCYRCQRLPVATGDRVIIRDYGICIACVGAAVSSILNRGYAPLGIPVGRGRKLADIRQRGAETSEQCPAQSPGGVAPDGTLPKKGTRCGLDVGHDGDHSVLMESGAPWCPNKTAPGKRGAK